MKKSDAEYKAELLRNKASAKRDLQLIKQLFWDVPRELVIPVTDRIKDILQVSGEILNPTDDVRPSESIGKLVKKIVRRPLLVKVVNSLKGLKSQDAKYNLELKKRIDMINKEMKKEGNVNMKKDNNKKVNYTKKNGSTSRNSTYNSGVTKTNHPEWYLKDPLNVKELVGINISNRLNTRMDRITSTAITNTPDAYIPLESTRAGIASVAAVKMTPTIPHSVTNDWKQGVNMLYKNIRSANAGAINYSPGQLANYILNLRSVDIALSLLLRNIRSLNHVEFYDALSPQVLFAAYGMDYDSWAKNAANARELYNRLSVIRYRLMPLNISLLDRTRWLFSNVFKDSDDAKSQLYAPSVNKVKYFKVSGAPTDRNATTIIVGLNALTATTTGITYDAFSENILKLFDLYQVDDVAQIIAGDILKAYGTDSLNKLPDIGSDVKLEPVYDINVLTQIQNASLGFSENLEPKYSFTEDFVDCTLEDLIASNDVSKGIVQNVHAFDKHIIDPTYNSNVDVLDAGKILSSTRLMCSRHGEIRDVESSKVSYIVYDTYGTEIVNCIYVYDYQELSTNPYHIGYMSILFVLPMTIINSDNTINDVTYLPAIWSWFDYFPYVIPCTVHLNTDNTLSTVYYRPPMFDFNNFGIVYKNNLDSYNAIATLSMLFKPLITRVNKTEVYGN